MYLLINGTRHSVSRRIVSKDTIKYLTVEPAPGEVRGKIQMFRNDGALMCEDNADKFARKLYGGTLLTLTNVPEPVKVPVDPNYVPPPSLDERVSALEGMGDRVDELEDALAQTDETAIELYEATVAQQEINASVEATLAQTDETAIDLYEAQAAQEETNAAQDEALIELYEMMEG